MSLVMHFQIPTIDPWQCAVHAAREDHEHSLFVGSI
jgi:hypothetical protein